MMQMIAYLPEYLAQNETVDISEETDTGFQSDYFGFLLSPTGVIEAHDLKLSCLPPPATAVPTKNTTSKTPSSHATDVPEIVENVQTSESVTSESIARVEHVSDISTLAGMLALEGPGGETVIHLVADQR